MAKKLLDLSTEIKRDFIIIDGEKYDVCAVDDVTLDEFIWLGRGINKVQKQLNDEESGDSVKLVELLDQMAAKVVKVPAEVLAKVSDFSKLAIIVAFFNQATKGEGSPVKKKTSSRPDSKGSTAAVRKTG